MSNIDLIIKGRVVLPERSIEDGHILVKDGKIAEIGEGTPPEEENIADYGDAWILPGIVDGQVHTGSQANREGIGAATRAAAAGGVTTIVDMPYDEPVPVINADIFLDKVAVVEAEAHVDVALYGSIAKFDGVREIPAIIEAGACGFKFSTYETDPTRFARIAPYDMFEAFKTVAPSGLACGVHNENQEIIDYELGKAREQGLTSPAAHNITRPPISEMLATAEVYELGAMSGCRAHIVHCSISRGFDLCESYKQQGHKASIETCVQYLSFAEEDLDELGARIKQNPPIRPRAEVEKLWEHVARGHVDFVSSDHVAWSLDRKTRDNFLANSSGMPGLETLLPAFYTGCVEHGLPVSSVVRHLCEGPARHFCLYPQKGAIRVNSDADFAVLSEQVLSIR